MAMTVPCAAELKSLDSRGAGRLTSARLLAMTVACALGVASLAAAPGGQQPPPPVPVPRPFPGAAAPPVSTRPADAKPAEPQAPTAIRPATSSSGSCASGAAPTEATLMVRVPPTAEYLESFDAGRGQCFHLFGTNDAYADVVQYFRSLQLKGARELFRDPPMQQFELGRYDDRSMAFPPSLVVKDYTWNNSEGYPFVKGTTQKRFKTIIQIVPPK
jgi:hypothetical protein